MELARVPSVQQCRGTLWNTLTFPLCPLASLERITTYLVPLSGDLLRHLFTHRQGTESLPSPLAIVARVLFTLQSKIMLGPNLTSSLQPTLGFTLPTELPRVRTQGPVTQLTFEILITWPILFSLLSTVIQEEDTYITRPVLVGTMGLPNLVGVRLLPCAIKQDTAMLPVFRYGPATRTSASVVPLVFRTPNFEVHLGAHILRPNVLRDAPPWAT